MKGSKGLGSEGSNSEGLTPLHLATKYVCKMLFYFSWILISISYLTETFAKKAKMAQNCERFARENVKTTAIECQLFHLRGRGIRSIEKK